ncbi:outer membrane lipoprotein-sorting protein [bacterium]|nr:outer membrane lipoprotein-sorting protein [bacterium]
MNYIRRIIIIMCVIGYGLPTYAQTVTELMSKIDSAMELNSDITARVQLTQQRVNQGTRVLEMVYRRRDTADAFLIVMMAPEIDKGNGYLKSGDNFWMYRKNTRTFQHINRDESIGGTDANAGDFEQKKLIELYKPAKEGLDAIKKETLGRIPAYKFEIKAKSSTVKYPKKVYWVRQDNGLPLKEESYSLSGTLMATNYYLSYASIDNHFIVNRALFIDEFEKGNKTVMSLSEVSLKPIDASVFSKAYLENLSK